MPPSVDLCRSPLCRPHVLLCRNVLRYAAVLWSCAAMCRVMPPSCGVMPQFVALCRRRVELCRNLSRYAAQCGVMPQVLLGRPDVLLCRYMLRYAARMSCYAAICCVMPPDSPVMPQSFALCRCRVCYIVRVLSCSTTHQTRFYDVEKTVYSESDFSRGSVEHSRGIVGFPYRVRIDMSH